MPESPARPPCRNCRLVRSCRDSAASWLFFFVGLVATIAVRLVNVALDVSMVWAKAFWYVGIVGFTVYFVYKFRQDTLRRRYIDASGLREKLSSRASLGAADYDVLASLLCSLRSRKDAVNYFFIFFTSALALLLALYQDFLR